ncbi:MAG: hypothetical protein GF317_00850 [Candidatus Lokiarchaeota archaeon]|nr:hypothetical protein [Candidatus Lokiarchaeota archaeon]MBD3198509.1 hypothetical protein [Candidatus Lokiarchaeota archaeon]
MSEINKDILELLEQLEHSFETYYQTINKNNEDISKTVTLTWKKMKSELEANISLEDKILNQKRKINELNQTLEEKNQNFSELKQKKADLVEEISQNRITINGILKNRCSSKLKELNNKLSNIKSQHFFSAFLIEQFSFQDLAVIDIYSTITEKGTCDLEYIKKMFEVPPLKVAKVIEDLDRKGIITYNKENKEISSKPSKIKEDFSSERQVKTAETEKIEIESEEKKQIDKEKEFAEIEAEQPEDVSLENQSIPENVDGTQFKEETVEPIDEIDQSTVKEEPTISPEPNEEISPESELENEPISPKITTPIEKPEIDEKMVKEDIEITFTKEAKEPISDQTIQESDSAPELSIPPVKESIGESELESEPIIEPNMASESLENPEVQQPIEKSSGFISQIHPQSHDKVGKLIDDEFNKLIVELNNVTGEEFSSTLESIADMILERRGFSVTLHQIRTYIRKYKDNPDMIEKEEQEEIFNEIEVWKGKIF